jgi:uncharacterized surface protein with fasciclin (FAS1) repeats
MTEKLNLIETIAKNDKFSTFSRVLNSSGAGELLNGEGEFTVFAPTNDAFAKIPEHTINELFKADNKEQLKTLLAYHFLPGKVMSKQIAELTTAKSLSGQEINIDAADGLKVNGSRMQARNMEATNGVVHAIDTVLAPSIAATTV